MHVSSHCNLVITVCVWVHVYLMNCLVLWECVSARVLQHVCKYSHDYALHSWGGYHTRTKLKFQVSVAMAMTIPCTGQFLWCNGCTPILTGLPTCVVIVYSMHGYCTLVYFTKSYEFRITATLWILGRTVTSRVVHYWLKTTREYKYWKLHEFHKNAIKGCIPYERMGKTENFQQLLKHILRVFSS